jgi:hypothetical protein
MAVPSYDIFRGYSLETDVLWIESVEGLGAAAERMRAIAAEKPGPYFVFSVRDHEVLASIDTTPKAESDVA